MTAASLESRPFPHRANEDGTFDSICPSCYVTVAHQRREADLEAFERRHICDEWLLERYGTLRAKPARPEVLPGTAGSRRTG